jgi:hypothetical protein
MEHYKQFKTPWSWKGRSGDLIVTSFHEHLGMHLADLRSAVADPTLTSCSD